MNHDEIFAKLNRLRTALGSVLLGKESRIKLALIPLLSGGHLLIEDVPGVGKTMLAKSIAKSLGATFRRIQCTPDMLPLDITGSLIFNQKTVEFEFKRGPVFCNVLLADEINRTTPRTQSALLECMEERTVSVDGIPNPLEGLFFVVATSNPVEQQGTFPLPEAQLDRFMLKISIGYPERDQEVNVLTTREHDDPLNNLSPVLSAGEVTEIQNFCRRMHIASSLKDYIVRISTATRDFPDVVLGASPRGSLSLMRASQALAMVENSKFVTPDHIKAVAPFVLSHRLILKPQSRLQGITAAGVISKILKKEPVPVKLDD
ncbi:MAG: MoxR family ATPase [Planctomycetes bacterium]|nr:MoxR family ATPase [Planctomycetota bacterium]